MVAVSLKKQKAGFRYSTNQLFWLTALPALCGATLRIFYAFAVPVIGHERAYSHHGRLIAECAACGQQPSLRCRYTGTSGTPARRGCLDPESFALRV